MIKRLALCAALALSFLSAGQAQAQTYTRPSKGAAVTVFDTASLAAPLTSAVYDMSAFVEVQLDVTTVQPTGTFVESYNVSRLPRYIKIVATANLIANNYYVTYQVQGSDAPGGSFSPLGSPEARKVVSGNVASAISSIKLIMTPLPYATNQYSRPAKGNPTLVLNKLFDSVVSGSSGIIDMRGFASLSVTMDVVGTLCRYQPTIYIYGGYNTDLGQFQLLSTQNAIRPSAGTDNAYIVNAPTNYIYVAWTTHDYVTPPNNCTFSVSVTPLPYESNPAEYGRIQSFSDRQLANTFALGWRAIPLSAFTKRYRLQNYGPYEIECMTNFQNPAVWAFKLAAPSTTDGANGGVIELDNFTNDLWCRSRGAGDSFYGRFAY